MTKRDSHVGLGLLLLLAGQGCQDTISATGSDTSGAADASSGAPESSGPGSAATTPPGDSSGPQSSGEPDTSSSEGSSTGASSEAPVAECGNGVAEQGEACDASDLAGSDCVALGFEGGKLGCSDDCSELDTSMCTLGSCCTEHAGTMPGCDNAACADLLCGLVPECCSDSWSPECAQTAFMLCPSCSAEDVCGNHVLDGAETCDNEDLAGAVCSDLGFDGGFVGCAADCSAYDTSECYLFDGSCCVADGTPGCDDLDCANTVIEILPTCAADWDELCAGLANGYCNACGGGDGECCTEHMSQGCENIECVIDVCPFDPSCCYGDWDAQCAAAAGQACAVCAVCGDGLVLGGEDCDGDELVGQTCETQGFIGGQLACGPACGFDTSACVANGGGDCCSANGMPGCDDDTCTTDVCYADESCCEVGWTEGCAETATSICATCGGTPEVFPCVEQDLGSALGPVASGDTTLADDDVIEACAGGGGVDHVMMWSAPMAGDYMVDTIGSSFDTVVSVQLSCGDAFLCDDDSGGGGAAAISGYVPAGLSILISVSGPPGETGAWVLNITPV